MLNINRFLNNPVDSNCFVIYNKAIGTDCVIVDPGSRDNGELFSFLDNEQLEPQYIILTHEHFDHCWGVNALVERYHIPIVCSALCAECIQNEKRNCSVFYDNKKRFVITSRSISVESFDFVLSFGNTQIHFFESLGHTNASICFTIDRHLFTGDTLIKDLRTVTKLPTGSMAKLLETKEILQHMQGEGNRVYPGHGDMFELDEYDLELMFKGAIPK